MLTDFILTTTGPAPIECNTPCTHLADRTRMFATSSCKSPKLIPIYHCPLHGLASPFGDILDADVVKACCECDEYERKN